MYLNNILGNNNGMDAFSAMQQQSQQALQNGMQAQNALMQTRGSAMQDAVQAFQQQEAEEKARAQQALSLGLSIATGGFGGLGGAGAAAGEAAAGTAAAGAAEAALPSILQNVTGTGRIIPINFY